MLTEKVLIGAAGFQIDDKAFFGARQASEDHLWRVVIAHEQENEGRLKSLEAVRGTQFSSPRCLN